jgi:hypothetical protein
VAARPTQAWLLLRQAGRPDLVQLNASAIPYLLGIVSATTVVASRRPRHPVGWLLVALGLSVALDGVISGYAIYGALARPGSLPAARQVAAYAESVTLVGRVCVALAPLALVGASPRSRR